jgi:hypothetical protein
MRPDITRADRRGIDRQPGPALPGVFRGLVDLLRWAEAGRAWPRIISEHPAHFCTLRAARVPDCDLVNQLLCELALRDVRQMFLCPKAGLCCDCRRRSAAGQEWVAELRARAYACAIDKAGARAALFGPEPAMKEPPRPAETPDPTRIAAVGHGGADGGVDGGAQGGVDGGAQGGAAVRAAPPGTRQGGRR